MSSNLDKSKLEDSLRLACEWVSEIAQLKTETFPADTVDSLHHRQMSWKGAIRGEYNVARRQWDIFCPVWHTGQAVKGLLSAAEYCSNEKYRQAARDGAAFIFANQIWDTEHPDHGLILAYEDLGDKVNTSAILEAMHGLMMLADAEKSETMWERLIKAGEFVLDRFYMTGEGIYRDTYDPAAHSIFMDFPLRTKDNCGGRPLLDDGIMLHLYRKTGQQKFLDVQVRVSERLVADQNPPGNWIDYSPCNARAGSFHPRQAYWWGLPLLETYRQTQRREFLETAIASGEFLKKALRKDGGFFRGYYLNSKTDSFGHATSASACAAIFFLDLFNETKDAGWREAAELAIGYCMKVQFVNPADGNIRGAILEKVLPPDGTDRSPYHIRDLGTIFFIQAAVKYLTESTF